MKDSAQSGRIHVGIVMAGVAIAMLVRRLMDRSALEARATDWIVQIIVGVFAILILHWLALRWQRRKS